MAKHKLFYISAGLAIASTGIFLAKPVWFNNFFQTIPEIVYPVVILVSSYIAGTFSKKEVRQTKYREGLSGDGEQPSSFSNQNDGFRPPQRYPRLPKQDFPRLPMPAPAPIYPEEEAEGISQEEYNLALQEIARLRRLNSKPIQEKPTW